MKSHIVVVGAGPVGLAFALSARASCESSDCDITLIERTLIERQTLALARLSNDNTASSAEQLDTRVYALSPGSRIFLENLGVWQKIPGERITDVGAMQIWGDDEAASNPLNFEENTAVAHIVEHAALMNALIDSVHRSSNIRVIENTSVVTLSSAPASRRLTLSNGETLDADLLVAADGARSHTRDLAGITVKTFDYKSDGVVANFEAEFPHGNIARQWFHGDSVLAYLPLPNQQISIVWSLPQARADELLSLDAASFAAAVADAVAAAGRHTLGKLTLVSKIARVGLHRLMARDWVQANLALIGDAAHAIHPMAGQGVNLGFADARALVDALQHRSALSGVGDLRVLRQYERARREDAATMGAVTHGLRALYLSNAAPLKRVRNQGLTVLNRMRWVKSLAMNHAMK